MQLFKLINAYSREENVLNAEEAHQEASESTLAHRVNFSCSFLLSLHLFALLFTMILLFRVLVADVIMHEFQFALFDVLHADLLQKVDQRLSGLSSRAWVAA